MPFVKKFADGDKEVRGYIRRVKEMEREVLEWNRKIRSSAITVLVLEKFGEELTRLSDKLDKVIDYINYL